MQEYSELEKEIQRQLEDKDFIKWLVEDLDRRQQGALLLACGHKISSKAMQRFPTQYMVNQLVLSRRKLVQDKILPPFPFILTYKEEELTAEKILEIAKEYECDSKGIALMLLLQNHYEASLEQYNQRKDEKVTDVKQDVKTEKIEQSAGILSPKIEKRLQEKIRILTKEKEELLTQVKSLKEEVKQKNLTHQNEINELKRNLAEEITAKKQYEENYSTLEIELEKEKVEKNHLAAENLMLETKIETEMMKHKKKIAFIGDPMNASILAMKEVIIDVYDIDDIDALIENWTIYDHLFYLTYTIDEMFYEEIVPKYIQQKIEPIENFMMLKRKLGGIAYV